ncbi:MAG: deoxyguanosinetriphosphate triphosphohydrolase [Clostridia bacterium]|nr:deoxyguanosinetriphosphate triphosphohydrolase [Clostridia bacterium]
MTIREMLEERELTLLSPLAQKSAASRGRKKPVSSDDLRTDYQRDRDRILHSKAFRRLKGKTQVFLSPEGDHYRTRLTHTLEVTQVARSLARGLRLNEDLTEAIALGHDLGHTPFGHAGESVLRSVLREGFEHRQQSRRVVEVLEKDGEGLNLTFEVINGIEHHSGPVRPLTLEGSCVHLADRIAYINHDIDDALRAGIIDAEDLPRAAVKRLGDTHGKRIDTMIKSVIKNSYDRPVIYMEEDAWDALLELRSFLFRFVYSRDWAEGEAEKTEHIVRELFWYFTRHPTEMPNEYIEIVYREGIERAAADYVAGMTDRYAVSVYERIFIPTFFGK